jgi:uncharacterized protein
MQITQQLGGCFFVSKLEVKRMDKEFDKALKDPSGFVRFDTVLSNEGVMEYLVDGKLLRGYLPEDELQKLAEVKHNVVVTNEHPGDMVTPETYKELSVGHAEGTFRCLDGKLWGEAVVADAEAIKDIQDGKRAVSIGYKEDKDFTPGFFTDVRNLMKGGAGVSYAYDFVKRNLEINHLALVDEGNARSAKLVFDQAYTYTKDTQNNIMDNEKDTADTVDTVAADSKENDMQKMYDDLKAEYDAYKSSCDAKMKESCDSYEAKMQDMKTQYDSMRTGFDSLTSENEGLKTAIDITKKSSAMDHKVIDTLVSDRLKAWESIGGVTNKHVAFDAALTPLEIRRAYLTTQVGKEVVLDGKDASFIDGMFTALGCMPNKASQMFKSDATDAKPQTQSNGRVRRADGTESFSVFK